MDRSRLLVVLRLLVFGALLVVSAAVRETPHSAVEMAIVWLPTGVAVAGLHLLGTPAAWVVAVATMLQRWSIGYDWGVSLTAAAGSTCEALLGAWVLRRLGLQRQMRRLRDVGAVLAAAAIAPLGSILFSWPGRMWVWLDHDMPFYSGWDGWWRMNALAVIVVVPAALVWIDTPRDEPTARDAAKAALAGAALAVTLAALLALMPTGVIGVMWLNLVLVGAALFVAERVGMRGATLATVVSGLVVVVATTAGVGPFVGLPKVDRHVAVQLFELALVALPLAFAALIAERHSAEAASHRHEALLESINRNVQDGLFRAGPAFEIVYANLALARLLGSDSPDSLLGRSLGEAFADPDQRDALLARLDERGQVHDEEVRFRRADGTTIWGLVSGTTVRDASGRVVHYDGAVADITARRGLEEQVRQSQKMEAVGRLAGGIAHDFNNLLTVILGYAEALGTAVGSDDTVRTYAHAVRDAGIRAAGLTQQLLAYSRRQVLSPSVLDLTEVIDRLGDMLRRVIGEDVRLSIEHGSGRCWVRADRGQLEQVLLNLAVNSRDAIRGDGAITVSTSVEDVEPGGVGAGTLPPGAHVLIRVRDTGIGMTSEVLAHAFDPFFTTKDAGRGTGLGLATVYGIVQQSGGSVWLESEPGKGTTACVALPCVDASAADGPPPGAPPRSPQGNATVLVVEDEAALRALISQALTVSGFRVLQAANGADALRVADSADGRLDLVVTDVVMPVMGGVDMATRMLARWPNMRFLFISGYPDGAHDRLVHDGEFLAKPFAPSDLISRVDALVRAVPR